MEGFSGKHCETAPVAVAAPRILRATFHESLTYVTVTFDAPTNGDVGSEDLLCDQVLVLAREGQPGADLLGDFSGRSCLWISPRELRVTLGYGATLRNDTQYLTAAEGVIFGMC